MKKKMMNNKGMTLVEIIVAMAIFGVVSFAFLLFFSSGIRLTVKAWDKENALMEATSQIDDYKTNSEMDDEDPATLPPDITLLDSQTIVIEYGSGSPGLVINDGIIFTVDIDDPATEANSSVRGFKIR